MEYDHNKCEYERGWKIEGSSSASTGGASSLNYITYTCVMVFCPYPEKKCGLKAAGHIPSTKKE